MDACPHPDTEQTRYGLSNLRNPALASHAVHLLPNSGLGSGILRATAASPRIEQISDRRGSQFNFIVHRPEPYTQVIGSIGIGPGLDTERPESPPESKPESLEARVHESCRTNLAARPKSRISQVKK
jgi:hypothetical protein